MKQINWRNYTRNKNEFAEEAKFFTYRITQDLLICFRLACTILLLSSSVLLVGCENSEYYLCNGYWKSIQS